MAIVDDNLPAEPSGTFVSALIEAGRSFLISNLRDLCAKVDAAESSIMRQCDENSLSFFAATNAALLRPDIPQIPIAKSFSGLVFRTGQLIAMADASSQPGHFEDVDAVVGEKTYEFAAIPIASARMRFGVLTLVNRPEQRPREARPFSVDELRVAQQFAVELVRPVAILNSLDHGGPLDTGDDLHKILGDEFVSELLSLDRTGRRVIKAVVAALFPDQES
jgi:signal transduction protein with GAF and PtsI domain